MYKTVKVLLLVVLVGLLAVSVERSTAGRHPYRYKLRW